jgi:hypothetical protein
MRRENGRRPSPRTGAKRPRRNRRRPDWLRALLSGLLLVLGAECVWVLFHTPRLAVQRVAVTGSTTLSAQQVAEMAGIQVGENIFRTNLYRVRRSIRSAPAIREATVARLLPGTIVVTLAEREPRLILLQEGRSYEVDSEGVVFRELPRDGRGQAVRRTCPYLALRPGTFVRLGEAVPRPLVEAALHCVRLARAEGLLLWKLSIDAHDDLWLNVKVAEPNAVSPLSLPIRVGTPRELGAKFADTRDVLQHAPQLAAVAQYLDVSCPRRPAYRVAAGDARS